jgi:hypothetical protein
MRNDKPMRIFTSRLTEPPRYYATRTYRSQIDTVRGVETVVVTGKKWDVTDDIQAIVDEAASGSNRATKARI